MQRYVVVHRAASRLTPSAQIWGFGAKSSAVAVQDFNDAGGGIDAQFVAGAEEPGHVAVEAVDQRDIGESGTLRQDRVDTVEDQPPRHDRAPPSNRSAQAGDRP